MSVQALLLIGHSPVITDRSVGDGVAFPGTAVAGLDFFQNGALRTYTSTDGSVVRFPEWLGLVNAVGSSPNVGAPYEIRLTVSSGSSPDTGDLAGTWLSLTGGSGGARTWYVSRSSLGTTTGSWLAEIRSAASGEVLASATFEMTAQVSSP